MSRAPRWALLGLLTLGCAERGDEQVSLSFVGDILLDSAPGRLLAGGGDPFAPSAPLLHADFSVGNLECSVATSGAPVEKMYTFRAAPATLPRLHQYFDAVSVANNHSGDYGPDAFLQTLSGLRAEGLSYFGGGRDAKEAHAPLLLHKRGLTIALLGYDDFHPRSFEAGAERAGVAWAEESQLVFDIQRARAAGADVVLPFLHWGWENEGAPCDRQRELARAMIDAGASAVIGSHPHVTQGVEVYRGRPIVYSLGNFLFDLIDQPANAVGWQLRFDVDRRGVVSFTTAAVRLDDAGTPFPAPNAVTPCGLRRARASSSDAERRCFVLE